MTDHDANALGLAFTAAHRDAIEADVERRAAAVEVERQKKKVTTEITDTAWGAARLFEALHFAYVSVANNRSDDYKQALLALNHIPKGDLIVGAVFVAHERMCDDGTDDNLSRIAGDICEALTNDDFSLDDIAFGNDKRIGSNDSAGA